MCFLPYALLLFATLGIMNVFLVCYTATFELFPLNERGNALKWCNLISRFITIFAPVVAEIPDPGPTEIILLFLIIALISAFQLDDKPQKS